MKKSFIPLFALVLLSAACKHEQADQKAVSEKTDSARYTFIGGYPTEETIQRAYDDADLKYVSCKIISFYSAK